MPYEIGTIATKRHISHNEGALPSISKILLIRITILYQTEKYINEQKPQKNLIPPPTTTAKIITILAYKSDLLKILAP